MRDYTYYITLNFLIKKFFRNITIPFYLLFNRLVCHTEIVIFFLHT